MSARKPVGKYMLCVRNDGYPASLELRKIYRCLSDPKAADHRLIRIVDESGEDYLFPASYFVPIEVPASAKRVFASAR